MLLSLRQIEFSKFLPDRLWLPLCDAERKRIKNRNLNLLHLRIRELACSCVLRRKGGKKCKIRANLPNGPPRRDISSLFPSHSPLPQISGGNPCERVIHPEDSFRHLRGQKPRSALSPSLPHSSFPDAETKKTS